jgi:hypothetical protein
MFLLALKAALIESFFEHGKLMLINDQSSVIFFLIVLVTMC